MSETPLLLFSALSCPHGQLGQRKDNITATEETVFPAAEQF